MLILLEDVLVVACHTVSNEDVPVILLFAALLTDRVPEAELRISAKLSQGSGELPKVDTRSRNHS